MVEVRLKSSPSRHSRGAVACLTAAIVTATFPGAVAAVEGELDTTFGSGGSTVTNLGTGASVWGTVVQPDDSIVLSGSMPSPDGADLLLLRYDSDGTLDSAFGSGGVVATNFGPGADNALGIAIQADGRLVVTGYGQPPGSGEVVLAARYLSDGSLDSSFGTGGKVIIDLPGFNAEGQGVVIQPDGKIVISGYQAANPYVSGSSDFLFLRLHADGSLDTSFGVGGLAVVDSGPGLEDVAVSVTLDPDGRIVAAGGISTSSGTDSDVAVVRLQADGSPDPTFGPSANGVVRVNLGGFDYGYGVAVQPDGKALAFGGRESAGGRVVRLTVDGNLDASFGIGGIAQTGFAGNAYSGIVQPDGRILVGGGGPEFAVARLLANGSLDPAFGAGGVSTTAIPTQDDSIGIGIGVQSDGSIVLGGYGFNPNWAIAVIRLLGSPADPDANDDGVDDALQPTGTPAGSFVDPTGSPATTGTIVATGGLVVTVSDSPPPAGVQIAVGPGTGSATVSVCGGFTLSIAAGSTIVVTCGSVTVQVVDGEASLTLGGGVTVLTVPEGGIARVSATGTDTYDVTNLGPTPIQVTVDGESAGIPAGGTRQVATWQFTGFGQPIDGGGTLNLAKAGRVVPLRWQLLDSAGAPVGSLTTVKVTVQRLDCGTGTTLDQIEEYAAGASGLLYLGNGTYQFNWQTPSSYAGSCKTMQLDAGDGVLHTAAFKFAK